MIIVANLMWEFFHNRDIFYEQIIVFYDSSMFCDVSFVTFTFIPPICFFVFNYTSSLLVYTLGKIWLLSHLLGSWIFDILSLRLSFYVAELKYWFTFAQCHSWLIRLRPSQPPVPLAPHHLPWRGTRQQQPVSTEK